MSTSDGNQTQGLYAQILLSFLSQYNNTSELTWDEQEPILQSVLGSVPFALCADGSEQVKDHQSELLGGGQEPARRRSPRKRQRRGKRRKERRGQTRRPSKGEESTKHERLSRNERSGKNRRPRRLYEQLPKDRQQFNAQRQAQLYDMLYDEDQDRQQAPCQNWPEDQAQPHDEVKYCIHPKNQVKQQVQTEKPALRHAQATWEDKRITQANYQDKVGQSTEAEIGTKHQAGVGRYGQFARSAQAEKRTKAEYGFHDRFLIQAKRRAHIQRRAQKQGDRSPRPKFRVQKRSGKFGVYSPLFLEQAEIQTNNVNMVVDAVLSQLLECPEVRHLIDPLKIEGHIPIDKEGNYVNQIVIKGLTTFGRTADALLAVLDDGSITVEAGMGIKMIDTTLAYHYKVGSCGCALSGIIGAKLDGAKVNMKIRFKGFVPSLVSLDVDFGDPEVIKFTGTSFLFNWLTKLIVNKVIASRKEKIRQHIIAEASEKLSVFLAKLDLFALLRDKIVAF
ncbi:uncharacterized protein LOC111254083 isoform X1 [Varroa destructor]|uniref:Uncharacterized protein n=2 Tax=Varroa destructor TaxID=109461 RepID=A0A7M7KQ84_VARDE|nr:uncharacterized protein LOC111254083 isoform X1 [Varroa destructor]